MSNQLNLKEVRNSASGLSEGKQLERDIIHLVRNKNNFKPQMPPKSRLFVAGSRAENAAQTIPKTIPGAICRRLYILAMTQNPQNDSPRANSATKYFETRKRLKS